jgi:hypothetical protein
MRRFWWPFLAAITALFLILGALAIWAPTLPYSWCAPGEIWRVCYREWLGAVSGWAAFAAAIIALAVQRALSDRDHRRETRLANLGVMKQLDGLINEVTAMIAAGVQGHAVKSADFRESYFMSDPEIARLERVPRFTGLRFRAYEEARACSFKPAAGHNMDANSALLKMLVGIYKRLDAGESVEEIAID